MLNEFLASGVLNIVYASVLIVSFIFTLLTLVGAEIGDALDFDLDADTGFDFISISPFAIAIFGAFFGLTGLITRLWFEMSTIPSILWATGIGLILGIVAQLVFIYVLSPTVSQTFSLQEDAVGREADVTTTIPGSGLGAIAYNNKTGRVSLGARSETGNPIPTGTIVTIQQISGRVAVVKPRQVD